MNERLDKTDHMEITPEIMKLVKDNKEFFKDCHDNMSPKVQMQRSDCAFYLTMQPSVMEELMGVIDDYLADLQVENPNIRNECPLALILDHDIFESITA